MIGAHWVAQLSQRRSNTDKGYSASINDTGRSSSQPSLSSSSGSSSDDESTASFGDFNSHVDADSGKGLAPTVHHDLLMSDLGNLSDYSSDYKLHDSDSKSGSSSLSDQAAMQEMDDISVRELRDLQEDLMDLDEGPSLNGMHDTTDGTVFLVPFLVNNEARVFEKKANTNDGAQVQNTVEVYNHKRTLQQFASCFYKQGEGKLYPEYLNTESCIIELLGSKDPSLGDRFSALRLILSYKCNNRSIRINTPDANSATVHEIVEMMIGAVNRITRDGDKRWKNQRNFRDRVMRLHLGNGASFDYIFIYLRRAFLTIDAYASGAMAYDGIEELNAAEFENATGWGVNAIAQLVYETVSVIDSQLMVLYLFYILHGTQEEPNTSRRVGMYKFLRDITAGDRKGDSIMKELKETENLSINSMLEFVQNVYPDEEIVKIVGPLSNEDDAYILHPASNLDMDRNEIQARFTSCLWLTKYLFIRSISKQSRYKRIDGRYVLNAGGRGSGGSASGGRSKGPAGRATRKSSGRSGDDEESDTDSEDDTDNSWFREERDSDASLNLPSEMTDVVKMLGLLLFKAQSSDRDFNNKLKNIYQEIHDRHVDSNSNE